MDTHKNIAKVVESWNLALHLKFTLLLSSVHAISKQFSQAVSKYERRCRGWIKQC